MTPIQFRKEEIKGLFTYLYVESPAYESMPGLTDGSLSDPATGLQPVDPIIYSSLFRHYLALADFCCGKMDKYVLLPPSPDTENSDILLWLGASRWRFELLSNDVDGLGADKGFVQAMNYDTANPSVVLFASNNFPDLSLLPEDLFGEASSQCSLFGLSPNRSGALLHFLQSGAVPEIQRFLLESELFFHVSIAKQLGSYNSILIKSPFDIDRDLAAFHSILDPDN